MIRISTLLCMFAAAGSGLYLYSTKHAAQLLDRDIGRALKQAEVVRERIGALRGEWAQLNEPEQLARLSQQHLGLRTLAPTQFVALPELAARLPAVPPAGSAPFPAEEPAMLDAAPIALMSGPAAPARPASKLATGPAAPAVAKPLAGPPAPTAPTTPVQIAALPTPPMNAARPVAKPVMPAMATPAAPPRLTAPIVSVAATPIGAAPRQAGPSASFAPAPLSIGESVARAAAARTPAAVSTSPAPIVQASVPSPSSAGSPTFASALGGLRSALPAPVPFGSAHAATMPATR